MTHENSVHTHPVEALPGPSYGPSVMADIGGRFGAVVLHTPETLAGHEIEIRPVGHEWDGTHTAVRERHVVDTVMWAAFFGSLHEGPYELRVRGHGSYSLLLDVHGGEVTEADW
jgi:hypothetical protein